MPRKEFEDAIDRYGDWNITKLRVVRRPLYGGLDDVAKKFAKDASIAPHDKYFHLWTEFALQDPVTGKKTVLLTEKNQTLNAVENRSGGLGDLNLGAGQEGMNVDLPSDQLTLGKYFNASKEFHAANGESFNRYSIKYGNCQHHTANSLAANNLLYPELEQFIEQRSEDIVPRWAAFVGNLITDTAAAVSNAKEDITKAVHTVAGKARDLFKSFRGTVPEIIEQHRVEPQTVSDVIHSARLR